MQIHELISYLTLTAQKHGDLPVYIRPCHTEYPLLDNMLGVGRAVISATTEIQYDDKPKRLQIMVD